MDEMLDALHKGLKMSGIFVTQMPSKEFYPGCASVEDVIGLDRVDMPIKKLEYLKLLTPEFTEVRDTANQLLFFVPGSEKMRYLHHDLKVGVARKKPTKAPETIRVFLGWVDHLDEIELEVHCNPARMIYSCTVLEKHVAKADRLSDWPVLRIQAEKQEASEADKWHGWTWIPNVLRHTWGLGGTLHYYTTELETIAERKAEAERAERWREENAKREEQRRKETSRITEILPELTHRSQLGRIIPL